MINRAGNATNFHYYGLPGNTNMTYGGSAGLVGVIYAPSAALSFGGSVNATELTGASVSKCVILNSFSTSITTKTSNAPGLSSN